MAASRLIGFTKQIVQQILKGNLRILSQLNYFSRWRDSLEPGRSSTTDRQPWITFQAIDFLRKNLNAGSKVFEYGGGGSTLFFVQNAGQVKTVEHDKEWYEKLFGMVGQAASEKWEGKLILPENRNATGALDPARPADYFSADPLFQDQVFKAYATEIDRYPDGFFDVVLVDGRVRPSCIIHSVPKIKSGGYLIIDNTDREYYFQETAAVLQKNFDKVFDEMALSPYADFLTKTGIWKKH